MSSFSQVSIWKIWYAHVKKIAAQSEVHLITSGFKPQNCLQDANALTTATGLPCCSENITIMDCRLNTAKILDISSEKTIPGCDPSKFLSGCLNCNVFSRHKVWKWLTIINSSCTVRRLNILQGIFYFLLNTPSTKNWWTESIFLPTSKGLIFSLLTILTTLTFQMIPSYFLYHAKLYTIVPQNGWKACLSSPLPFPHRLQHPSTKSTNQLHTLVEVKKAYTLKLQRRKIRENIQCDDALPTALEIIRGRGHWAPSLHPYTL